MASSNELLKYLKISVKSEREPGEEVKNHLKNTVLGTPGKLRYRHTSFYTKFPFLGEIYFLILRRSDKLLGSIAFAKRPTLQGRKERHAWYVRYFSIHAPFRDKTYKGKRMRRKEQRKESRKNRGEGLLKDFVIPYFRNPNLLAGSDEKPVDPVYAVVERDNLRSWNFTELVGFETVGKIATTIFSRFNPRKHPVVQKISEEDKEEVLRQLRAYYEGYTLYTEQNIFFRDQYFVWKENGQLIAGCQANPEVWEVVDAPGLLNKISLNYLSRLPMIKRLIDPSYVKFMGIEGIWHLPGREHCIIPLIETACAVHDYHMAMIWADQRSPLYHTIKRQRNLGLLNTLIKPVAADIRIMFNAMPESAIQEFHRKPAYISSFDMT